MALTATTIQALIEAEIPSLQDLRVVSHIRSLLVEPTEVLLEWEYGDEENPDPTFPGWLVLSHPQSNTGIAYCEFGFGPKTPWGLISLSNLSMGMDCGWFSYFLDAYFDSTAATDLPIWRVFEQNGDSSSRVALTDEIDWDSAWREIKRLRAVDPISHYDCRHSILRTWIHSEEIRQG
ncbi:hypothetical protein [Prosthecobacter sp.]|uniref:hypothetical protein n=1 Tax=Prosthecobacter sp. TaxID=1965333 RepID=UPI0024871723|nr:hypothetical protein [Prosthecobacter sp.]MDI1313739.1 hypothetical protein [Prosthecobacter sp.]